MPSENGNSGHMVQLRQRRGTPPGITDRQKEVRDMLSRNNGHGNGSASKRNAREPVFGLTDGGFDSPQEAKEIDRVQRTKDRSVPAFDFCNSRDAADALDETDPLAIRQEELREFRKLQEGRRRLDELRESIVARLEDGAIVEPGALSAELAVQNRLVAFWPRLRW